MCKQVNDEADHLHHYKVGKKSKSKTTTPQFIELLNHPRPADDLADNFEVRTRRSRARTRYRVNIMT